MFLLSILNILMNSVKKLYFFFVRRVIERIRNYLTGWVHVLVAWIRWKAFPCAVFFMINYLLSSIFDIRMNRRNDKRIELSVGKQAHTNVYKRIHGTTVKCPLSADTINSDLKMWPYGIFHFQKIYV